jgi:hypothetical protein
VFAVDSIPAIFAITPDPFIVFTSNIFAILGLRALYFCLAALISKFRFLKPALILILAFVGIKLLLLAADYSLPWREFGRQLKTLLDDGEGGIPGLALDQLWSFVPPSREQDPGYQLTKQKCETLLAEIQKGLAAVKASLAKLRKLLAMPPDGLAALAGRLGRNDAGDLIAVWQGTAPPQGRVWWVSEGRGVAVAGTVDDKGVFLPGSDVGPAGTPLFTIKSESKGATIAGQGNEAGGGP